MYSNIFYSYVSLISISFEGLFYIGSSCLPPPARNVLNVSDVTELRMPICNKYLNEKK